MSDPQAKTKFFQRTIFIIFFTGTLLILIMIELRFDSDQKNSQFFENLTSENKIQQVTNTESKSKSTNKKSPSDPKNYLPRIPLANLNLPQFPKSQKDLNFSLSEMSEIYQKEVKLEVDLEKSKNWLIVGFSDETYLPVAKIWYDQLTRLGYSNHLIVALNSATYQLLRNENNNTTDLGDLFSNYRTIWNRSKMDIISLNKLANIWRARFNVLYALVRAGFNVIVSDIDAVWVRYFELDEYLGEEFDTFHSYATTHPIDIYWVLGF